MAALTPTAVLPLPPPPMQGVVVGDMWNSRMHCR